MRSVPVLLLLATAACSSAPGGADPAPVPSTAPTIQTERVVTSSGGG